MNKARREFKQEAAALLRSSGRPLKQIAGELGIQPSMLRSWRRRRNGEAPRPHSLLRQAAALLLCHLAQHLRRRIRPPRLRACGVSWSARLERDILKNAIASSRKHRDEVPCHCHPRRGLADPRGLPCAWVQGSALNLLPATTPGGIVPIAHELWPTNRS